jgi:hypothetical protein
VALVSLLRYIMQLKDSVDIRSKIKQDFGLTVKFDDLMQNQPIMKKYNQVKALRTRDLKFEIGQKRKSLFK